MNLLLWITIFGHSWDDLSMIFTNDFVTHENHWQITPLMTKIIIHGNWCIIFYFNYAYFLTDWFQGLTPINVYPQYEI